MDPLKEHDLFLKSTTTLVFYRNGVILLYTVKGWAMKDKPYDKS